MFQEGTHLGFVYAAKLWIAVMCFRVGLRLKHKVKLSNSFLTALGEIPIVGTYSCCFIIQVDFEFRSADAGEPANTDETLCCVCLTNAVVKPVSHRTVSVHSGLQTSSHECCIWMNIQHRGEAHRALKTCLTKWIFLARNVNDFFCWSHTCYTKEWIITFCQIYNCTVG